MPARGVTADVRFGDRVITCTNTDREVFPATPTSAPVTKGDLIAYYASVADVMVPELRDRALTLERFTKGIAGGGFYQKHAQKHYPPWIDRVTFHGKTTVEYPVCNSPAALVYFANQGGLAFHVMTARASAPLHPDLLVFDLDPPEGRFDLVRHAALLLRELLEPLGFATFVKTTGSKGLHVCAALDGTATYAEVEAFTSALARTLVAREPDKFTLEFYKTDRRGRLFLDTMRNAPGATVVAPYSVRGNPGAPVSTPITWTELADPALTAASFRVPAIPARLATVGDPWSTLRARPGSIRAALENLTRG